MQLWRLVSVVISQWPSLVVPMARQRPDEDFEALASEIRATRPMGVSSVSSWLRMHTDLIEALQCGDWAPASGSTQPGKWKFNDIARALDGAGVAYKNAPLAGRVLRARVADIRREKGKAKASSASLTAIREIVDDVVERAFRRHNSAPHRIAQTSVPGIPPIAHNQPRDSEAPDHAAAGSARLRISESRKEIDLPAAQADRKRRVMLTTLPEDLSRKTEDEEDAESHHIMSDMAKVKERIAMLTQKEKRHD